MKRVKRYNSGGGGGGGGDDDDGCTSSRQSSSSPSPFTLEQLLFLPCCWLLIGWTTMCYHCDGVCAFSPHRTTSTTTTTSTFRSLLHNNNNNKKKNRKNNHHDNTLLLLVSSSSSTSSSTSSTALQMTTDNNSNNTNDLKRKIRWSMDQEERLWKDHWGWTSTRYGRPPCSVTALDVVEDAFRAIAGTLYDQQHPDPAILFPSVVNISLFSYRPQRSTSRAGRIGIEIDGTEHLFDDLFKSHKNASRAQRRFSLLLALKLATGESWDEFEDEEDNTTTATTTASTTDDDDTDDNNNENETQNHHEKDNINKDQSSSSTTTTTPPTTTTTTTPTFRPVVLSFNTLKEALLARGEMQYLQSTMTLDHPEVWDWIVIQSISDGFSSVLHRKKERKKHTSINNAKVDPKKGILVLCSPADYSREYEPPGPSPTTITDLQRTVAIALLHDTPVVVLSPRFSYEEEVLPGGFSGTIHQQHSYQQAGYYGGMEPPRGMSPWILRDFLPPSYCWIGNALRSGGSSSCNNDDDHVVDTDVVWNNNGFMMTSPPAPRVVMTNSVMERDHPWHMFAVQETWKYQNRHPRHHHHRHDYPRQESQAQYLGSTQSTAGRPTRALVAKILSPESAS